MADMNFPSRSPDCGVRHRWDLGGLVLGQVAGARRSRGRVQVPCGTRAAVARCAAAPAGVAAAVVARSGPGRNRMPQMTAPALKMAAATQNPVVYPWISDIPIRDGTGCPWTRVAGLR